MIRRTQAPAGGQPSPPPIVGGRYEIGPLLGSGGTAAVYRARDRVLRREVAIKLFHPGVLGSDQRRLNRELAALTKLDHPGVVEPYEVGMHGTQAFLAMQLVDGRTLADRLSQGPLTAAVTIALGSRIADTLAHVHEKGVTHRDLKPGNVLLGSDGALISDFGVAKLVDDTMFTGTGVIVGTACYMAPEQVSGQTVGPPADVYALALVLLECVTGHREYEGGPLEAAVARLHRSPVVPDDIPDGLARLLRRMTHPDPVRRPAARTVALDLRGIPLCTPTDSAAETEQLEEPDDDFVSAASPAGMRSAGSLAESPPPPRRKPSRALRVGLLCAAAVLLGVLAVVVPLSLKENPIDPERFPAAPQQLAPPGPAGPLISPDDTNFPASPVIEQQPVVPLRPLTSEPSATTPPQLSTPGGRSLPEVPGPTGEVPSVPSHRPSPTRPSKPASTPPSTHPTESKPQKPTSTKPTQPTSTPNPPSSHTSSQTSSPTSRPSTPSASHHANSNEDRSRR